MPDLVRWPQFRNEFVTETEQKVYDLVYVVDCHSVVSRGLQNLALGAFSASFTQAEARLLIVMLVHKDKILNENRQTQADAKSDTLRFDNNPEPEEEF